MAAATPAAKFYADIADTFADRNGEGVLAKVVHVTENDVPPTPATGEINRFFDRLGGGLPALAAPGEPAPAPADRDLAGFINALAAGANRSPAQVTALLNAFATSRVPGCHAVCGKVPQCRGCRLRPRCDYGNLPAPELAPPPPLERLQKGMDLTPEEMLALALGDGAADRAAAAAVCAFFHGSLARALETANYQEFVGLRGVGPKLAARLTAIARLFGAATREKREAPPAMHAAGDFFDYYRRRLAGRTTECFLLVILNQRNQIICDEEVLRGSVTGLAFTPGEALLPAIREHAAVIAFVHNHPSGDCTPSGADRETTRRLVDAAKILGLRVLDHLIIGSDRYYSFADHGEI